MSEVGRKLVEETHRLAFEKAGITSPRQAPPATIHHSKLPEASPSSPLFAEWNTYRREVARLLHEGNEGRFVLIKGETIVGLWDSERDAIGQGYKVFGLQPFLVHQIQERERLLRCA